VNRTKAARIRITGLRPAVPARRIRQYSLLRPVERRLLRPDRRSRGRGLSPVSGFCALSPIHRTVVFALVLTWMLLAADGRGYPRCADGAVLPAVSL